MVNPTTKLTPILTVSDVRDSVVGCYDYIISDIKVRKAILWQQQWDVVKSELDYILQMNPSLLSDNHIENWLYMTREFKYSFYFQKELTKEQRTVHYFGTDLGK
ncbi:MAG: hypothetical protein JKY58_08365 [Pseudomonas sp.]|nr:hypothetical protein [Pseudomonas sp.]